MARAYSKIAPAAAHAQHMTSHIFVAMGMWDDLVQANEIAAEIEFRDADDSGMRMEASHYVFWLQYGYLQQGRMNEARKLLQAAREKLEHNPAGREKLYYGAMYARYFFDSGDVQSAVELAAPNDEEISSPHYHFARAFAAISKGDLEAAHRHAGYLQAASEANPEVTLDESVVRVLHKELEAMTAFESDPDKAVALLREAAEDSKSLPIRFGPPQVTKPAHELLGEMLTVAGRPGEAVRAFEEQLEQTPLRAMSLLGLARAAREAGDTEKASQAFARLAAIWHSADDSAPEYEHVKQASRRSS
jgi:tetratricopeptide (TPR) repeat protein